MSFLRRAWISLLVSVVGLAPTLPAFADPLPFDLSGPDLRITVSRQGTTLPISEVPALAPGDRIVVTALLPRDQSAHYLLVGAFLRGPTNPPPDAWFHKSATWKQPDKGGGPLAFAVPEGAKQLLLFLAPATGGDFATLRDAVKGRPGAFVRATQDLLQASLDRARLNSYLAAVGQASALGPTRLQQIAPTLAGSLHIKIDNDCLTRRPELQAACLLENKESLILDDGHGSAVTDVVTGPGADLALQISATSSGGLGYYSPYISVVREIVGIFGSMHTARYQYIPALGILHGDQAELVLNTPPSFHNPKSVLVMALPEVARTHAPSLELGEPGPVLCAQAAKQALPVTAPPLLYATRYLRHLAVRVALPDGRSIDLPAKPDPALGGLDITIDTRALGTASVQLTGRLHGLWGFAPFDGPSVVLRAALPGAWKVLSGPEGAAVTLAGGVSSCVTAVDVQAQHDQPRHVTWKATGPDTIAVTMPALEKGHGALTIGINGAPGVSPDSITLAPPPLPHAMQVRLLQSNVERQSPGSPVPIELGDEHEIPSTATLRFSLQALGRDRFTGHETLEVGTEADVAPAELTVAHGLTVIDAKTALATLRPLKDLGPSAFGPLRARVVRAGVAGAWLPIGTLVRLPALQRLECNPAATCALSGENLFLVSAVSDKPDIKSAKQIPDGFPGLTISTPRPAGGRLYLWLHDAPGILNRISG